MDNTFVYWTDPDIVGNVTLMKALLDGSSSVTISNLGATGGTVMRGPK